MIIKLQKVQSSLPYEILDRETIQSIKNPISLAIWVYLQSKSDNWNVSEIEIRKNFNIGRKRYLIAMKELRDLGLYEYTIKRNSKGNISKNIFILYPQVRKPVSTGNPTCGENRPAEKPYPLNNKRYIKEEEIDKKTSTTEDDDKQSSSHLEDKGFQNIVFIYRNNGGRGGYNEDTYKSYLHAIKEVKDIKLLIKSITEYLHDTNRDKKVWLRRFLDEKIYQEYLTPILTIKRQNDTVEGIYDRDTDSFITTDKNSIPLDINTYERLVADGKVNITGYTT